LSQKVEDANELAARMARLARLQIKAGGLVSIENPEESWMWEYGPVKALREIPGVVTFVGDQCVLGGPYIKATSWLTNAPFMNIVVGRCPGMPTHPRHEVLRGMVRNDTGGWTWRTSLAAEYPESLCNNLVNAYQTFIIDNPMPRSPTSTTSPAGSVRWRPLRVGRCGRPRTPSASEV
jgi:hypothetical protein